MNETCPFCGGAMEALFGPQRYCRRECDLHGRPPLPKELFAIFHEREMVDAGWRVAQRPLMLRRSPSGVTGYWCVSFRELNAAFDARDNFFQSSGKWATIAAVPTKDVAIVDLDWESGRLDILLPEGLSLFDRRVFRC